MEYNLSDRVCGLKFHIYVQYMSKKMFYLHLDTLLLLTLLLKCSADHLRECQSIFT